MNDPLSERKNRLLFDHIPKTAGTSVDEAFKTLFPNYSKPEKISNHYKDILGLTESSHIGGHIEFAGGDLIPLDIYFCTILRNPADRFISQYFFNRSIGSELLLSVNIEDIRLTDSQVPSSMLMSIDEYINKTQVDPFNIQAHHFAARMTDSHRTLSDHDLADAAIASLERYDLVGSFDEVQLFVDAVARDFCIESTKVNKRNVTPPEETNRNQVTRATLEKANSVDFVIINWARQRFGWGTGAPPKLRGNLRERVIASPETPNIEVKEVVFDERLIRVTSVQSRDSQSITKIITPGDDIYVDIDIEATITEPDLTIGIAINDKEGRVIYDSSSLLLGHKICIDKPGSYKATIKLKNPLAQGSYSITIALHKGRAHTEGLYHWLDKAAAFIVFDPNDQQTFEGIVNFSPEMSFLDNSLHA